MKKCFIIGLVLSLLVFSSWTPTNSLAQEDDVNAAFIYLDLLSHIPDTEATRSLLILNDYARAEVGLDIPRPGEISSNEQVIDFLVALTLERRMATDAPFVSGFHSFGIQAIEMQKNNSAFDARNVFQTVVAGNPPSEFNATNVNVPFRRIQQALLESEAFEAPEQLEHRNVPVMVWGEDFFSDFSKVMIPPVYDEIGRGQRIGFSNQQTLLSTVWTDGVLAMIDAHQDQISSLADDGDYLSFIEAMQALNLYSVLISDRTQDQAFADATVTPDHIRLKPYRSLLTGIGQEDGNFYMALVLLHDDEEDASENASLLLRKIATEDSQRAERPWTDLFEFAFITTEVADNILQVRLPFVNNLPRSVWIDFFLTRDMLLLHE